MWKLWHHVHFDLATNSYSAVTEEVPGIATAFLYLMPIGSGEIN